MGARVHAVVIAALVLGLHAPLLRDGGLLGAPGTDVARAAWGLSFVADALPGLPFWTDHAGFPAGVKLLVLPLVSAVWGAPLSVLGPIAGYDAWILLLLWAAGFATARLATDVAQDEAAGLLAGTVMMVQPMLLAAVSDGTAELVAFWGVPTLLLWLRRARRDAGAALGAGLIAAVVALDSPYHAVFALPFVPVVLWGVTRRNLGILAITVAFGAALVALAYAGLDTAASDANRATNSTRIATWWQWESGQILRPWDFTLGTGFIPVATLAGAVGLAAARPVRALPWILVAAVCLALSLGPARDNPAGLGWVFGDTGERVGSAILAFNERFPVPIARFPRRWLVPVAMALSVAAGLGVSRVPWAGLRWAVAATAAAAVVAHTLALTGYHRAVPRFDPPIPAFATFVRDHDRNGAILPLPRIRSSGRAATFHTDLPVFAGLSSSIASADHLWTQALTGRASAFAPNGLRTMVPRTRQDPEIERLYQALDDLARSIELSEPHRLEAAASRLVDAGLAWVIADEAVYGDAGLAAIEGVFAARTLERRHFDDGSGVRVWVVGSAP